MTVSGKYKSESHWALESAVALCCTCDVDVASEKLSGRAAWKMQKLKGSQGRRCSNTRFTRQDLREV